MVEMNNENNESLKEIISRFKELSNDEKIEALSCLVEQLKSSPQNDAFPAGIFSNDDLSALEAIVKYMKENLGMKFSRIAKLLNRSSKTIWATYQKASGKMPDAFTNVSKEIMIPAHVVADRKFSTLESIVAHIKDLKYSNREIALMLHRDDSTIWTVYDKVKKKRGMKNG